MSLYSQFIKAACKLSLWRSKTTSKKERKISDELVGHIVELRGFVKHLKDFMSSPKVKAEPLFTASISSMLSGEPQASLGIRFDIQPLDDIIESTQTIIATMCREWEEDAEMFIKLIESWMPEGWSEVIDDILEEANAYTLMRLLQGSRSYEKIGKAGLVLNAWRMRFKDLNADTAGVKPYSIDFMKRLDL